MVTKAAKLQILCYAEHGQCKTTAFDRKQKAKKTKVPSLVKNMKRSSKARSPRAATNIQAGRRSIAESDVFNMLQRNKKHSLGKVQNWVQFKLDMRYGPNATLFL